MQLDWRGVGRWEAAAIALWILILTAVSVRVALHPASRTTYPIFSSSATLWWQGGELYFPHRPKTAQSGFRYAPAFAILATPFSFLPDALGGVLWRWLNVAGLLAALVYWARSTWPRGVTRDQLALVAVMTIPLALPSVNNGQVNVLVAGLLIATVAAVNEQRWNLACLALGLAFICKVYPLALGLVLVVLYPRQLGVRLLLVLIALLGLPFLCQEPGYVLDQYQKWAAMLLGDDRSAFGLDAAYRDLWLLVRIYEVPVSYGFYQVLQVAAGAAIALLCWMRQRQGWPRATLLNATLALTTAWMLLLGPAPESATFVLLAPSLAWATVANLAAPRTWPRLGLLFGATVLFGLAYMFGWWPGAVALHGKGFHPLATLFWVTYLLLERPPRPDLAAAEEVTLTVRAA